MVTASTAWHVDVVRNLRAARQALKPWEEGRDTHLQDSSRTLRSAVKKLELDTRAHRTRSVGQLGERPQFQIIFARYRSPCEYPYAG